MNAPASQGRLPDLGGLSVLVVDDNDDARATITATLHYAGASMTSADAGDHALDDLTQFQPDVIICDLRMPRLDGLTFMRRLRARPPDEGGAIPVVAITAYHEDYSPTETLGLGFAAYLRKPLDLVELCRVVRDVGRGSPAGGPPEPPRTAGR